MSLSLCTSIPFVCSHRMVFQSSVGPILQSGSVHCILHHHSKHIVNQWATLSGMHRPLLKKKEKKRKHRARNRWMSFRAMKTNNGSEIDFRLPKNSKFSPIFLLWPPLWHCQIGFGCNSSLLINKSGISQSLTCYQRTIGVEVLWMLMQYHLISMRTKLCSQAEW